MFKILYSNTFRKNLLSTAICLMASTFVISGTAYAQQDGVEADVKSKAEGHGHMGNKRKHGHPHKGPMRDLLKMVDDNGDGKVDLNEFLGQAEVRFNQMDLNGDQFVTPEEAKEAHKSMRAKHREERKRLRKERKRSYEQDADRANTESDQG